MARCVAVTLCTLVLAAGCHEAPFSPEDFQKASPAPEMKKLERLVGTWEGTAEMVKPTPEEMKEMMKKMAPEGEEIEEMPSSSKGEMTFEWAMDGRFLKAQSWHEMGPDEKVQYTEYWTWDPNAQVFHTWWFSDWGDSGQGCVTLDPDGKTFHFKGEERKARGETEKGAGSMTFVDNNTLEWTWAKKGMWGQDLMKMKGTSKRK